MQKLEKSGRSAFARCASFGETAFAYRMLALGYVAARSAAT